MITKFSPRVSFLILILLLAAFSRLIPHPSNFTPIVAMALFGAAYFNNRFLAILLPIAATWISDVVINNTIYAKYYDKFVFLTDGWYWIFGTLILISFVGFYMLKKVTVLNVILAAVIASILFFLITNLACFPGSDYPQNFTGLVSCYKAGVPFFTNTLLGNLFYSGVVFGIYELVKSRHPALKYNK